MFRFIPVFIFVIFSSSAFAQKTENDTAAYYKVPFFAAFNFSQTAYGKVLPTNGSTLSLGLNVAGLCHKKYILGVVFELRLVKLFGTNQQYGLIRDDVNANLDYDQFTPIDSARILFLHDAFNSDPVRHFHGSYYSRYGIMFSPFPDKFGGLMLQVKRGSNQFAIDGAYYDTRLKFETEDFIYLKVPVDLSVQLTAKPFLFLSKKKRGKYVNTLSKNVFVSAYYEHINLDRSELNASRLSNFLMPAFFEKNGTDNQFGFKISYGFY